MQNTNKHVRNFEAPSRVDVFHRLHGTITLTRHGVSFISFPPTDLSSPTQRGGNYLFLSETSAQLVCALYVKKANTDKRDVKAVAIGLRGNKSALYEITVGGHLI